MRLMLQRGLRIDEMALERIMQATLFYADTVTIRASATAPELSGTAHRRLSELMEMGAVRTWAHEYELSRQGRIASRHPHAVGDGAPHDVVPLETIRCLLQEIDDELAEDPALAYAAGPALREGVSEIVQLRHSMSTFRLADELGASGLLAGRREESSIVRSVERSTLPVDTEEAVVRELVGRCAFGNLSHLPLAAVEDCRRAMPRFRRLLDSYLTAEPAAGPVASPAELAAVIIAEYREICGPPRAARTALAQGTTWDVVGAVLPHAVMIQAMGRRIEWFKHRGRGRPFMLLGKLQHYTI